MNEFERLIEKIQLIFIVNKQIDNTLYIDSLESLKRLVDSLNQTNSLGRNRIAEILINKYLKRLLTFKNSDIIDDIQDNQIDVDEIKQLPTLFDLTNIIDYNNVQINDLLISSIILLDEIKSEKLSTTVHKQLMLNLDEELFHISFTSLNVLLFYYYKLKFKNNKTKFENDYNVEHFLDDTIYSYKYYNNDKLDSNILKTFSKLRDYLNDSDFSKSLKAYKLCNQLNISLSLEKLIFYVSNSLNERIMDNLVLFIGYTGVGKSLAINYICGTEYEINDDDYIMPKIGQVNRLKVSDENDIFSETSFCETLPYYFSDVDLNVNFCDTPGLFDTRQKENIKILANLAFPILINSKNTGIIKSIVILLEYDTFKITNEGRGKQFETISENLLQMFKDFDEIRKKSNISFIITKTKNSDWTRDKKLKHIKSNLKKFRMKTTTDDKTNEMKMLQNNKSSYETEIKLYDECIHELNMINSNKSVDLKSFWNRILSKFSFLYNTDENERNLNSNNNISYGSTNEEKSVGQAIRLKLDQILNDAKESPVRVVDKITILKNDKCQAEKNMLDCERRIKEHNAECLMIDLIETAIEQNNVFLFDCLGNDDKSNFLTRIKEICLDENNQIDKNSFNFESTQEQFKSINEWCNKTIDEANENYETILLIKNQLKDKNEKIKKKQIEILIKERDLERLLKKEQIQGVRKEDFQLISSYTNDIEHAESIITHCEDCIKKSNELIKEYQDETCIAINKSEVKPLLLKYLPILQWKFNYSHPTFPIDRLYLFSINNELSDSSIDEATIFKDIFTTANSGTSTITTAIIDNNCIKEIKKYDENQLKELNYCLKLDNIGKFKFDQNLKFEKGLLDLQFEAEKKFNGKICIKIFSKGKFIKEIQKRIDEETKIIQGIQSEKEKQLEEIKILKKRIEHEQKILKLKEQRNSVKFELIKERLYSLNYDKVKFIDYLLKKQAIDSQQKDILINFFDRNYSSDVSIERNEAEYIKLGILFDKIKVNHLDEFHSQLKKINDDDIRRLVEISTKFGFELPFFYSLFIEIEQNPSDIKSLNVELIDLINEREVNLKWFKLYKNKCLNQSKKLETFEKIYQFLEKILNISNNEKIGRYFENLEKVKMLNLFNQEIEMVKIEEIQIDTEDQPNQCEQNEIINEELNKLTIAGSNDPILKFPLTINFQLNLLTYFDGSNKRDLSIFRLRNAEDKAIYLIFLVLKPKLIIKITF